MSTKNNSISQFTDKYTKTGSIGNLLVKNFFNKIKDISPTEETKNVLEVGCGAGYSLVHLQKYFDTKVSFSACDIDPELVRLAKEKNPNATCEVGSIYDLPYKDKSFDTIYCLEVMEHLENPQKALRELARVARKNIIISAPNEPMWRILNCARLKYLPDLGNTPGHINHWSSKKLSNLISNYFEIKKVKRPLPWTIVYGTIKNIQ